MQRNFLHSLKAYLWELRGWLVVVHVHTTKRAQKIHGTRNGTYSKVAAIKKSISCIASTTKYSILSPLCRDIHYGFHATATTHGQHFEDLQEHGLFNLPKNAKQRGTEEESINRILLTTKSQNVVCFSLIMASTALDWVLVPRVLTAHDFRGKNTVNGP